jgi:hypothetical protein
MLLLGILMLGIARVPFGLAGRCLAVCGVVLLVRGIFGSLLIFRQP